MFLYYSYVDTSQPAAVFSVVVCFGIYLSDLDCLNSFRWKVIQTNTNPLFKQKTCTTVELVVCKLSLHVDLWECSIVQWSRSGIPCLQLLNNRVQPSYFTCKRETSGRTFVKSRQKSNALRHFGSTYRSDLWAEEGKTAPKPGKEEETDTWLTDLICLLYSKWNTQVYCK